MPGINNFLPFAGGAGANVISDAVYAALASRTSGFGSGVSSSAQFNKVWRQATAMSAALGQIIANSGIDANDSDAVATLANNLVSGFMGGNGLSPALFDDSGKVATTAYVMSAVGNTAGIFLVTGATSLVASQVGKLIQLSGSTAYTVTLPNSNGLRAGSVISFVNVGSGNVTITRTSSDVMIAGTSSITSVVMGPGDTLILTSMGPGVYMWQMAGTVQTRYSTSVGDIIGKVEWFARSSAPTGYLTANGAALSRTTYARLFAAIGTTFGAGDGSTTFNIPDMRDKMPIGSGVLYALAATGGSKDAIVVAHSHTGNTASAGAHVHTTNFGYSNDHDYFGNGVSSFTYNGGGVTQNPYPYDSLSAGAHTHTVTVDSTGSSGTNANLPPYVGLLACIKY